jgi:hypothetical protein
MLFTLMVRPALLLEFYYFTARVIFSTCSSIQHPTSESTAETRQRQRQRQQELQLPQNSYDPHVRRWLMSLESEIGIQERLLDNIPTSGDSNMTKIRDIEVMISSLKGECSFH